MSKKSLFGDDEMIRWADKAIASTKKRLVNAVERSADKMEESARSRHKFNTDTGAVDESIKAEVELTPSYITLTFFLDTSVSGIMLPSGYNKAWLLNDGWMGKYRRGLISPYAETVGGSRKSGYLGDDFMGRTWRIQYRALDKQINKIMDGIR
jgi:hypothetical protein